MRLDHSLLTSPAYRSLSPVSRALLVELVRLYNGKNNGMLAVSERDAASICNVSRITIRKGFAQLIEVGILEISRNSYFNVKSGDKRCREYALTWLFNFAERKPASNAWRSFVPPEK